MKKVKDNNVIIFTMILNFIVATIKLVTGITFSFSTLIADSIQSFVDFITDIMSVFANKLGKRRANKTYPFGYGQIYYVANMFTGFLLFLIGIFIVYQFFFFNGSFKPNIYIFIALGAVLILKFLVFRLLEFYGKNNKSELMIESSKESKADFISTCVVFFISILTLFEDYFPDFINFDKIGSLGMAIYVFITSIKMIFVNIVGLLTNSEDNEKLEESIKKEIEKFENFKLKNINFIKMSAYYNTFIEIEVSRNLSISEYLKLEKKLKKKIKSKHKEIRFIDIKPV